MSSSVPSVACHCANDTTFSLVSSSLLDSTSSSSCQDITFTRVPFSAAPVNITVCVDPTTFGTDCDTHWTQVFDNNTVNIATDDWYDEKWCFVDPLECQDVTTFDANILEQLDLALSYAPCGSVGTYKFETRFEDLRGETIRVAYPPVSDDVVYYSSDPQDRDGVAVRFFNQIFFEPLELNVVEKTVSDDSLERFSSPYTACIHDIAIGAVDLCPVPLFRTADRLLLADFTFAYSSVKMILIVNSADHDGGGNSDSVWRWMWTPLSPFTWQAWLAILLACLYMELAKRIIHKKIEGKRVKNPAKEIGVASFNAVVSITAGGEAFIPEKTSLGEKIMIAGFAIFAWIFMSAYTASFTFSLISEASSSSLDSLKDILTQDGKICMLESSKGLMMDDYTFLSTADIEIVDEYPDVVAALDSGKCKGGVIPSGTYDNLMAEDEDFCLTKTQIGDTLLEVPLATPTSEKFADALNYVVLEAINNDIFDDVYNDYASSFFGAPICEESRRLLELESGLDEGRQLAAASSSSASTAQKTVDGDESNGSNLTIPHMILPLLTTLLCTTVGLVTFLFSNYREKVLDNLDKNLLSHDDHSRWQEKEMRGEISQISSGELMKVLIGNPEIFPPHVVDEAINKLPDRGPLENLLFQQRKDDVHFMEKFSAIQSLTVAEIYCVLIEIGDDDIVEQANEALDSLRPKKALISIAMHQTTFKTPQKREQKKGSKLNPASWKESFGQYFKGHESSVVEVVESGSHNGTGRAQTDDSEDDAQNEHC